MIRKSLILFAALAPLQAGLIIGTADLNNGNVFPFGATGSVYQQVYAPSDFSGILDITNIEFYRTQNGTPSDPVSNATYTIKLSYSANPVNGLDTTTFANNVGAGQVTFGTYVLSGVLAGAGLTFVDNNSDFVYNPATGPLLVEIDLSSVGTIGDASLDAMNNDSGGLFSRAHNFGGGFSNYGLVTGFDASTAAVPEPATAGLIGCALLGGLTFLRRRS